MYISRQLRPNQLQLHGEATAVAKLFDGAGCDAPGHITSVHTARTW